MAGATICATCSSTTGSGSFVSSGMLCRATASAFEATSPCAVLVSIGAQGAGCNGGAGGACARHTFHGRSPDAAGGALKDETEPKAGTCGAEGGDDAREPYLSFVVSTLRSAKSTLKLSRRRSRALAGVVAEEPLLESVRPRSWSKAARRGP